MEKRDNMIVLAKERVRDRDSVATNDISKNYIERVKMIVREAGVPFFLTTLNPSLRWTWLTGCKRR